MGVDSLDTPLTITITGDNDADWLGEIEKKDVPEAVWGKALPPGSSPKASAKLLKDRVVGVNYISTEPHVPEGPGPINTKTAFTDVPVVPQPYPTLPLNQQPTPQGGVPAPGNAFNAIA